MAMEASIERTYKTEVQKVRTRGISGSTLKLIAISAMLIDHIGAAVLERYMALTGFTGVMLSGDMQRILNWMTEYQALYIADMIFRMVIGRIAFPIFCFLLVEGFARTRDVKKYALRLGAFALISEIPFDLAFNAKALEYTHQNVFFTLFLGLLTMIAFELIGKSRLQRPVRILLDLLALAAGFGAAQALRTDYAGYGVAFIMILYVLRNQKVWQTVAGSVFLVVGNLAELFAPLGFIPIRLYNGSRGLKMKYFFYLFYPVHLLILYGISMLLGIQGASL